MVFLAISAYYIIGLLVILFMTKNISDNSNNDYGHFALIWVVGPFVWPIFLYYIIKNLF